MIQCKEKGINDMNIIDLETPSNTENTFPPKLIICIRFISQNMEKPIGTYHVTSYAWILR